MRSKLFVTLFFDKARFILLFLLLVSVSGYLLLKQVDSLAAEPETIERPDVEIMGSQTETYPDTSTAYAGIDDFILKLDELTKPDTKIYSMIARDLYTFANPFYQVSFRIYGVETDFFGQFEGELAYGDLPGTDKKEVLAGGNAALYYGLKVGDILNDKIKADIGLGAGDYVVAGILEEKDRYYANGFYVLKDNFQNAGKMPENNMVMIYAPDKQSYKELDDNIDEIKSAYELGAYVDNHNVKNRERNVRIREMLTTFAVSLLILELVYMYISKGMEKKAGIVKALGIPDGRVLAVCGLGFGVLSAAAAVIIYCGAAVMLDIGRERLFRLIPAIGLAAFFILFTEVAVKYKRIKPGASMPAV